MGFLDLFWPRRDETTLPDDLSPFEGILGIAVAAASYAGEPNGRRLDELARTAVRFEHLANGDADHVARVLRALVIARREQGAVHLADRAARAVPPEHRAAAFAVAADLLLDRNLEEGPRFLAYLRERLGVSPRLACRIEDVMRVKHAA